MQGKKIGRGELKPGDHIYTWRPPGLYAHHGIYVGNGNVIHFMGGQESGFMSSSTSSSSSSSNQSGFPCPICGYESRASGVVFSCLDCFLSGGNLYLYQYGVSPFFLITARGGTCTRAHSDPPEDVLRRATYLLKDGFGSYNVLVKNSENFAVYCKTSLVVVTTGTVGQSSQARSFLVMPLGFGFSAINRFAFDIGVRPDVIKIPVERLYSG